ncbi:MAG: hypothetical protein HYT62_05090 [Candidatus Yanofskybacteria bacterium]|nr:hypothetical protein [Candidatus Yanofskybacteria bacterium]
MISKFLNLIKSYQYHVFLALCIGLISFVSYNLGQIDALNKRPLKITDSSGNASSLKADIYSAIESKDGNRKSETKKLDLRVVISKTSTSKKYHYSWCASAKKIKPENQVWFSSATEAEKAGYNLAGNCLP